MSDLFSCLAHLVRAQIPESLGLDADCHTIVAQDAETLTRMEDDARGAQSSLTGGLSILGKLLLCKEAAAELEPSDVQTIGDFLISVAETLHELNEMEAAARDGLAGIAARPTAQPAPAPAPEPAPTVPPLNEQQRCLVGLLRQSFDAKDGEGTA
jgi:hypothetical protein